MEIEGILPELTLLSFSVKDQVFGNSNDPDYNSYYFPDPGLIIKDNYWDSEDIIDHNGIEIISSYQFVYYYDDETPEPFNDVWEFPNRSLNLANIGNFKVKYQVIDNSDNESNDLERDVKVTDSRKPVVKLYGANPMYVDLQSILDEESRYQDPGAYAIENLYVEGKGFFDWQTQDDNLAWRKTYQLYDWDLEVFGDELEDQENDLIETTIIGYKDDPSTLPTQAVKFKVNYYLTDEANNTGSSSRIVEIRGSPNLYPHIYIVMAHPDFDKGIPSSSNIEGNLATLPSIVWQTEVGVDQFNEEPDAIVFEDLGGGIRNTIDYSTQLFFLDDQNQSQSPPSYGYLLSDYLTKVNYWLNGGVRYYAELFDSTGGNSYNQIASGEDEWRRVIIRYTSNTNELGNYSVRDLEIQLLDTTPPTIIKNTFNDTLLEVGEPFNDPGVVITDVAGSSFTSSTVIDLDHPEGESVETIFGELSTRGFWTTGDFTITYSAEDNFSNQSESQILNLTVQDSKDPHVAVITHDALNKFNAPSAGLDNSDLEYEYSNDPVVSPHSIFENSSTLSTKLKSLSSPELYDESTVTFSSEIPYLVEDGTKDFLLKASELDSDFINLLRSDPDSLVNGVNDSNSYIEIDDVFGRTFVWYSPLTILFNDGKTLQDPGVLIYEPSSSGVDVSVTIVPVFKEGTNNLQDNSQIESISLSLTVQQTNNGARQTIINNIRTYRFLDDIKPLITISPDTDDSTTFIVVEAGSNYDDNSSNGQAYRMSIDGNVDDIADTLLSIQADDVSDGSITSSIVRTITDLNDSSISSIYTSYNFVNHIYKIEYNVQDSGGNAADPVERYLIIKDTIAPLIYPQADANSSDNFEIDYLSTSPNTNLTSSIEDHLLSGLVASDYGALGAGVSDTIDSNLDTIANRDKWTVEISKPSSDITDPGGGYDEGRVYPFAKDDNGYVVTITVTDEFGNTSPSRTRSLKIGDYQKPVIGLIGEFYHS